MSNRKWLGPVIAGIVLIFAVVGFYAVTATSTMRFQQVQGKTWVEIDPDQCTPNPWEADWVKSHTIDKSDPFRDYPRGKSLAIEGPEAEIIKRYYETLGIEVADAQRIRFEKGTSNYPYLCEACECPRGYTIYLLVPDSQVDRMVALGYSVHQ